MLNMKRYEKAQQLLNWPQSPNVKTKRLYRDEREAMTVLYAIIQMVQQDVKPYLWERAKAVPGLRRDLALLDTLPAKIAKDLAFTIEPEQGVHLSMQLDNLAYAIGIKDVKTNHDDQYGQFLSYSQISALAEAAKSQCLVCAATPAEEQTCPLKKVLDTIATDTRHDGGCGYKLV